MIEVILGGNGFTDCATIIAFGGQPLLGVVPQSGELELRVPARSMGSGNPIVIRGARVSGPDSLRTDLRVLSHEDEVRVFVGHALLLVVSRLSETSTHVHLDLRPLGVRVFSDSEGLYVGPHKFFNLAFRGESPAISVSTDGSVG